MKKIAEDILIIENDRELLTESNKWENLKELAVDLEMEANLHYYGTHLCIIQISSEKETWIIDMLGIKDAKPIKEMMENEKISKIFHETDFDFRMLQEAIGCKPKNVFDTKIAAELLGKEKIGLGTLMEEYFHIKQEKKYQKADWMKRPIIKEQIEYAVKDSKYLIRLKKELLKELKEKNRETWALEENKEVEKNDYKLTRQTYEDIKGEKNLNPKQRGRLKTLFAIREQIGEKVNKPVFFVISHKRLLELAKETPKTEYDWRKIKGVHPQVRRESKRIQKALEISKPIERKTKERLRLTNKQREKLNKIMEIREKIASKIKIKPHLIINQQQLISYVTTEKKDKIRNWQKKLLFEN